MGKLDGDLQLQAKAGATARRRTWASSDEEEEEPKAGERTAGSWQFWRRRERKGEGKERHEGINFINEGT